MCYGVQAIMRRKNPSRFCERGGFFVESWCDLSILCAAGLSKTIYFLIEK